MYPLNLLILCAQYPILVSLKILEWANNNVQRYIKLSAPMDETLYRDSTVYRKVVMCGIQMVISVTYIVRSAHSCFQIAVMVNNCFALFQVFVVNLSTTETFTWIWVSLAFHNRCLPLLHTYIVAYTIVLLRYSIGLFASCN